MAREISDERIRQATGAGRAHWFAALDAEGAASWPHRDIAAELVERHGLEGWWAQTVAVAYERARGLRETHERPDGFSANKQRTVAAPAAVVWQAWADPERRAAWLPEPFEVTSATEPRSVNGRWGGGPERVSVWLTAKDDGRTAVAVSHERLPDAAAVEEAKAAWAERLARLAEVLARE